MADPGPKPGAYRLTVISVRHFVTGTQVEETIEQYLKSPDGRARFDERQYRQSLHDSGGRSAESHTIVADKFGMQIETRVVLEPAQ